MNIGFASQVDLGWSTEPEVGLLHGGHHDPQVRGFTMPNSEISLDGSVDPYFRGYGTVAYQIDAEGETGVELEEAYFLTTSLPGNLQVKGGQFFTEFGRRNPQHPHAWGFVDQPVVLTRMFGPDGLRGPGARLSWLAPTPWYAELMVTVLNSLGETAYSFRSEESSEIHGGEPVERGVEGLDDLLLVPRLTASFDLTETQTLLLGTSAAWGPNNSGTDTRTSIYGVDAYWKWKSARAHQGFPFVSLQAEFLSRRYQAAARESIEEPGTTLAAETLTDHGGYAEFLWGVRPRIVAGMRGERVTGIGIVSSTASRARTRWSPSFTVYPSEFSKLRLQYNLDKRAGLGWDHSIWLQFEFILGAHAAHKF